MYFRRKYSLTLLATGVLGKGGGPQQIKLKLKDQIAKFSLNFNFNFG